jgi:ribosomal protein L24
MPTDKKRKTFLRRLRVNPFGRGHRKSKNEEPVLWMKSPTSVLDMDEFASTYYQSPPVHEVVSPISQTVSSPAGLVSNEKQRNEFTVSSLLVTSIEQPVFSFYPGVSRISSHLRPRKSPLRPPRVSPLPLDKRPISPGDEAQFLPSRWSPNLFSSPSDQRNDCACQKCSFENIDENKTKCVNCCMREDKQTQIGKTGLVSPPLSVSIASPDKFLADAEKWKGSGADQFEEPGKSNDSRNENLGLNDRRERSNSTASKTSTIIIAQVNNNVKASGSPREDFRQGDRVEIISRKHKGKYATVEMILSIMVWVRIDGENDLAKKMPKSLKLIEQSKTHGLDSPKEDATVSESTTKPTIENDGNTNMRVTPFREGDRLEIVGGSYKGKYGVVVGRTLKLVKVEIDGVTNSRNLQPTSLKVIGRGSQSESDEILPVIQASSAEAQMELVARHVDLVRNERLQKSAPVSPEEDTILREGLLVSVTGGKYAGSKGSIVELKKMVKVKLSDQADEKWIRKNLLSVIWDGDLSNIVEVQSSNVGTTTLDSGQWRWPDSSSGGRWFGKRVVTKVRLACPETITEDTFLTHWLQRRILLLEIPLKKSETSEPFEKMILKDGSNYELVSAKVHNDGDAPSFACYSSKCAWLVYALASEPGIESCSLQEMLEGLGDFGRLKPRKAASRLELLQSPACKLKDGKFGIFPLNVSKFCEIQEQGFIGCGFICEDLLFQLVKLQGGATRAGRVVAIQVRIYVPKYGIFKGMLCKKRITSGPPIQLPSSMKKVGPSRKENCSLDEGLLLITKIGLHPFMNNEMVGRLLDPNQLDPPTSFWKNQKKLTDMITDLWKGLGVPKRVSDDYVRQSVGRARRLQHAFVVGVADPTMELPSGTVYVTGLNRTGLDLEKLFVTRSPCMGPCDGRMLEQVTKKPDSMSEENWKWLESLHFGAIIFSNPLAGEKPLPELVASGDLDGDLYFVCWDHVILSHINRAEPIDAFMRVATAQDDDKGVEERPYDPNWLEKAQEIMVDCVAMEELNNLFGKLYKTAKKLADESPESIFDPDARCFARAYQRSLDLAKHGGKIYLPEQLHKKLPKKFHKFLVTSPEYE